MISHEQLHSLFETQLKPILSELDIKRKKIVVYYYVAMVFYALMGVGFIVTIYYRNNPKPLWLIPAVIGAVIGLMLSNKGYKLGQKNAYYASYKKHIVSKIFEVIDSTWTYDEKSSVNETEYKASKLFPQEFNRFVGDDLVYGKIDKTNSKKVRFEGNEYFHNGPNKISFEYKTYRCSDYDDDKNHDKFTVVQISQLAGAIDEKVVQEQEIDFTCGGYDVYAHYYAEGFADVEVVWRNVQIVIPDDESDIAVLYANGDYEGENIPVPYAVNIPGYGKEIYYSWTENEYEIPEVIKMKSLVKNTVCWINKTEDGLNSCSVEKIPGGSIQLVLQFDLYIGEGEQITVGTDSEFPNAQTFPWLKMENEIIEKIRSGEEVKKVLKNQNGATLTITFKHG